MSLTLESSSIKLKRHTGSTGASPSSLLEGEFAINLLDGHLFYGSTGGSSVLDSFTFGNTTLSGSLTAISGSQIVAHFNDPLNTALSLIAPGKPSLVDPLFNTALITSGTINIRAVGTVTSSFNHHLDVNSMAVTTDLIARDLVITNTASINYLHTIEESASIIYTSGSTTFGNTLDDLHRRTGSVEITGSLKLNGANISTSSYNTQSSDEIGLSLLKIKNFDDNITVTSTSDGILTLQFGIAPLPILAISNPSGTNKGFISNRFSKQSCSYELAANWNLVDNIDIARIQFKQGGTILSTTGSITTLSDRYKDLTTYSLLLSKDGTTQDNGGNTTPTEVPLNESAYRGFTTGSQVFTASIDYFTEGSIFAQTITASISLDVSKGNPSNDLTLDGNDLSDITIHNAPNKDLVSVSSTQVLFEQGLSASISNTTSSISSPNNGWVGLGNSPSSSRVIFFNKLGIAAGNIVDSKGTLQLHNALSSATPATYFSTSSTQFGSAATGEALQLSSSVFFSASYTSSGAPSRTISSNTISANDTGGTPNLVEVGKSLNYQVVRSIRTFASPSASVNHTSFDLFNINEFVNSIAVQSQSIHFLTFSLDGFTYQNDIPAMSQYPDGLYQWIIFDSSSAFATQISEGGFNVTDNFNSGTLIYGFDTNVTPRYRFYRKKVQDGAKSTTITFTI